VFTFYAQLVLMFSVCQLCVNQLQKVDETLGNVHSGARPPWLETTSDRDASVNASAIVIGPTADDLQRHCGSFSFHLFVPLADCTRSV